MSRICKTAKRLLVDVCDRYGIEYPTGMQYYDVQAYIEKALTERGLEEFEISQEFSSDWECLLI